MTAGSNSYPRRLCGGQVAEGRKGFAPGAQVRGRWFGSIVRLANQSKERFLSMGLLEGKNAIVTGSAGASTAPPPELSPPTAPKC